MTSSCLSSVRNVLVRARVVVQVPGWHVELNLGLERQDTATSDFCHSKYFLAHRTLNINDQKIRKMAKTAKMKQKAGGTCNHRIVRDFH
jgi:hypothetical protein